MKIGRFNISLSAVIVILLSLFLSNVTKNISLWEKMESTFTADVAWYYSYLPATIVYNDLQLSFEDSLPYEVKQQVKYVYSPTQKKCIKTTSGMAMLYSPFFFVAHIYAKLSKFQVNGYSLPYRFALVISGLFFLILGLIFLRKLLLLYYGELVTSLTIIYIVVGTNLLYYSTFIIGMTHAYNFALIIILLYFFIKWHENQKYKYSIIIGLLMGLLVLIRPTNIILLIPFLLFNVKDKKSFLHNFKLFLKNYKNILVIILCAFIIWIPQFLYWKYISGSWIFFSYTGERFFFNHPQILKSLFSYRNGWLLYSPVMIFALLGIITLYIKQKGLLYFVLIFTLINIYINASWWCWWFPGFGNRAYIESYAILVFPLASLLDYFLKKNKVIAIMLIAILAVLTYYNNFQIRQFRNGTIDYHGMTKEAYWNTFLKKTVPSEEKIYFEYPHYEKAKLGINDINRKYMIDRYGTIIDKYKKFVPIESLNISALKQKQPLSLTIKFAYYPTKSTKKNTLLLSVSQKNRNVYNTINIPVFKKDQKINSWNDFEYTFIFDTIQSLNDILDVYFFHPNDEIIYVDNVK